MTLLTPDPVGAAGVLRSAGVAVPWQRLSERFLGWRLDVGELLAWRYGEWYAERCLEVARRQGRSRLLTGTASTSRDADFGEETVHTLLLSDGSVVEQHLPWLMKLYRRAFLKLANELVSPVTGRTYVCSPHPVAAVNLNLLVPGETYEWHVDSNPLTGLLFCPVGDDDQSELVFRADVRTTCEDWEVPVRARWGELLLFDARYVPHGVRNVTVDRVTVPMNFHDEPSCPERPGDLDGYLYG